MHKLQSVLAFIDTVNDRIGKIASFLIVAITLILVYEVVMRYMFNSPTIWVHETTQFVYGAHFLLAGAYCLLHRAHVNVDVLYMRFPLRARAIVDAITAMFFFLLIVILLWHGTKMAWESLMILETTHTFWAPPVYPIKMLVPIEALLVLFQGLAKFIRDLLTATTGKEVV